MASTKHTVTTSQLVRLCAVVLIAAACSGPSGQQTLRPAEPTTAPRSAPASTPTAQATVPSGPSAPTVPSGPSNTQQTGLPLDSGNGRLATVQVVLSNTNTSDGSYSASGPARFCGNADFNLNGNERAFNFQFPLDLGTYEINDVTFDASDLVPGSNTDALFVSVNVTTADGHEPPATVADSEAEGADDTGQASLSESAGTRTLVVNATNDFGESIQLTASCAP